MIFDLELIKLLIDPRCLLFPMEYGKFLLCVGATYMVLTIESIDPRDADKYLLVSNDAISHFNYTRFFNYRVIDRSPLEVDDLIALFKA